MNSDVVRTKAELEALISELSDYHRSVSYNLSEIKVVPINRGMAWLVIWRKDGQ